MGPLAVTTSIEVSASSVPLTGPLRVSSAIALPIRDYENLMKISSEDDERFYIPQL